MKALRYLLDSDTCIYLIKQRPVVVAERLASLPPGQAGVSVVSHGELWRGALRSQQPERNLAALAQLISVLPVQALPVDAGMAYGRIRAALERGGTPIGGNDYWIAAHAVAADLILVTNNTREFARVADLRLENWWA